MHIIVWIDEIFGDSDSNLSFLLFVNITLLNYGILL
jgi:hypothetical protein